MMVLGASLLGELHDGVVGEVLVLVATRDDAVGAVE